MFSHVSVHPSIHLSTLGGVPRPGPAGEGGVPQPGPVGGTPPWVPPVRPGQGGTVMGGTPPQVPPIRPGQGGTPLRYLPVGPGWGVPHLGYPPLDLAREGVPHLRYPLSDLAGRVPRRGVPHLRYPPLLDWPGGGTPVGGGTPPHTG